VTKLLAFFLLGTAAFAGEPKTIPIWPGAAPGSENWTQKEFEVIGPNDTMRRVHNVTRPTLLVYLPDAAKANGTGIVVCPGGGFRILAIDHEGIDVARWLNSLGVAAFVLKYRLMETTETGGADRAKAAAPTKADRPLTAASAQETMRRSKDVQPMVIADGQQAMRVVRAHAAEWGVARDRIGIMGFSAGGYVTTGVALHHDAESRPNFAAPIYPAAPEDLTVPADAPPLFIVQADDDPGLPTVNNSVRIYTAWKNAKISAEMHIYAQGKHGFGMKKQNIPTDTWTDRFRDWLDAQGFLKAR
jgi:acetyl esterase/lipase